MGVLESGMQIAVYGGSFNPPHVGHAMVAGWLTWTRRADSVWLVPCVEHAFDKELAPFAARKAMCEALARAVGPQVLVSDIEVSLPTPNYTWNTLRSLSERHPEHRFRLVVGADTLDETHLWHRWDDIVERFTPIIVGRGGFPPVPTAPTFPQLSSTELRAALARGEPVDHLVVAGVIEHLGVYT
ncbi:MAG TPA: nicotinate-nicotinamide nucleotide adenylyltransferase [Myxococcota bacterium]|nr:nicotinate-nicotinamide nucleotide adenylyltransferase [Myxococcota bacterium]